MGRVAGHPVLVCSINATERRALLIGGRELMEHRTVGEETVAGIYIVPLLHKLSILGETNTAPSDIRA